MLERISPGAVTRVNRAVAESKVFGPGHGLGLLAGVKADGWHLYWSVRSELERQMGLLEQAVRSLHRALARELNESDRTLLEERLAALAG